MSQLLGGPEGPRYMIAGDVAVGREAITLPLLLLTVAALGGVRIAQGGALTLVPPSLMSLILATVLLGALVRSRALVPGRLVNDQRSVLENSTGVVVLVALLAASSQVFTLVTPATGLLAFVFTTFFVLLLWNTLAVAPDRGQLLRSLLVVFGGAFVLKFVVLAALYEPQGGLLRRVMLTLLDGVSLGTLGFVPDGAATGYLAFATLGLYFVALLLLPASRSQSRWHPSTSSGRPEALEGHEGTKASKKGLDWCRRFGATARLCRRASRSRRAVPCRCDPRGPGWLADESAWWRGRGDRRASGGGSTRPGTTTNGTSSWPTARFAA